MCLIGCEVVIFKYLSKVLRVFRKSWKREQPLHKARRRANPPIHAVDIIKNFKPCYEILRVVSSTRSVPFCVSCELQQTLNISGLFPLAQSPEHG